MNFKLKKFLEENTQIGVHGKKTVYNGSKPDAKEDMGKVMGFICKEDCVDPCQTIGWWTTRFGYSDAAIYKLAKKMEKVTGIKPVYPSKREGTEEDDIARWLA